MLPISQTNLNISRGPKNSKEFIEMCNDIHYDIVNLFSIANTHDTEIKYNMDMLMVDNMFLQNKICELEAGIATANNAISALDSKTTNRMMVNTFKTQNDIIKYSSATSPAAKVDNIHGIVTFPYKATNKCTITDSVGNVYTPSTLSMTVYESTDGINYVQQNSLYAMRTFDGNNSSCWMHTSVYPDSNENPVNEIWVLLHIKLPLRSINNAYVNSISIKPYPEYSMDIVDIKYTTPNNSTPQTIANFPTNPIQQSKKTLFMFPATEITELFIYLKQPYYFVNNGQRYFYYGMQELSAYYYNFSGTSATIMTKFDAGVNKFFKVIHQPRIKIPIGCPSHINNLVRHELCLPVNTNGSIMESEIISPNGSFGQNIATNHRWAYIKTILTKTEDVVPALSGIEFDYLTK